jgi:hypothetical protein
VDGRQRQHTRQDSGVSVPGSTRPLSYASTTAPTRSRTPSFPSTRPTCVFTRGFAVGLPLCWIALLPLSSVGGALLAGGYWLALGTLMAAGTLRRSEAHAARATAATA